VGKRKETEQAWKVSAKVIAERGFNLDIKNRTPRRWPATRTCCWPSTEGVEKPQRFGRS